MPEDATILEPFGEGVWLRTEPIRIVGIEGRTRETIELYAEEGASLDTIGRAESAPGAGDGLLRHGQLVAPDVQGVMLDPAGLGIVLAQLLLCQGANAAAAVEDDGAGTGGALVERKKAVHRRLHDACGRRRRYSKREMNSTNAAL